VRQTLEGARAMLNVRATFQSDHRTHRRRQLLKNYNYTTLAS